MCGITAFFSSDRPVAPEVLQNATRRLAHRGPDGQRQWIAADGRVGLGHARLSIIDLTQGDQPLANENDRLHLIVNGEFYDFERIRRELQDRGHYFRTGSDSEIALHLYEELGPQSLHELRGEFAFVLWDEPNHTLFAARDRFGIKPLFYSVHKGILYLASEVKALFAAGIPGRWDRAAFYQAHSFSFVLPGDRTLFAGIHQVPPGHYLLATQQSFSIHRYWDFDYPTATANSSVAESEAVERFRAELDEAVRLRLRADVPVGTYLSGGIDSCAVLGLAARHRADRIQAFTLAFDRPEYDESDIAREMAARAGAEFFPIPIHSSDLAEAFPEAIAQAETLCINAHGVAKFLLSRAVQAAGYKVVLTGEGSDEILAGYPPFRRDLVLHNTQGQDPHAVSAMLNELQESNQVSRGLLLPEGKTTSLESARRLLGFVPTWLEANAAIGFRLRGVLSDALLEEFDESDPCRAFLCGLDVGGQMVGREPVHQSLYLWGKSYLPNYVLSMLGDRMEMAHSIEGRLPFLDHRVVELARSLPVSLKIRGATEKYILREATRDVLIDKVYRRHKHPFLSPPAALDEGGFLQTLLQDTLRGSAGATMPFYDQRRLVALLDKLPQLDQGERTALDPALMIALSACVLQQQYRLS
jgi:asparagine synthase (glutamine-hydrolysing)